MKKLWSISTTVRSPERIRDFLSILKKIEGEDWTRETQSKYQTLLIQYKLYGYGSPQFCNTLSKEHLSLMDNENPITYSQAQEKIDYKKSQGIDELQKYIEILENINSEKNRPLLLEKYITLGLNALNDSLKIQGNYLVGDDNEPINTAPAGKPDIECFYNSFNSICEVTMLTRRDQWYNEGQPVMRHLREFETQYKGKEAFCLFIAPAIHRDTLNTFWNAVKYEYEGNKQRIIPLTIKQFIQLLKILLKTKENKKPFTHSHILDFYNSNIEIDTVTNSQEWLEHISHNLDNWEACL